jgi:hypothetical protein
MLRCIGGSVDVQLGTSKRWRPRKLWISNGEWDAPEFVVYLKMRGSVAYMRTDGTLSGIGHYWRHIKLPIGFELYCFEKGRVVHVRDIVAATRQRLGVE